MNSANTRISIYDPVSGINRTFQLSEANARRAKTDMIYAQELMQAAVSAPVLGQQQQQPQPQSSAQHGQIQATSLASSSGGASSGPASLASSSSASSESLTGDESFFKWPHAAILLLLDTYRGNEEETRGGRVSQKKFWEKIALVLQEKGYAVTGPQCMAKFNGMKRTFKNTSDHNSRSGNAPKAWPYFGLMQDLLGERPFMEPLSLASSSSGGSSRLKTASESSRRRTTSESSAADFSDSAASPQQTPRKRRVTEDIASLTAAILESRQIAEAEKAKRHEERMKKHDSMLSKLDQLIGKIK